MRAQTRRESDEVRKEEGDAGTRQKNNDRNEDERKPEGNRVCLWKMNE